MCERLAEVRDGIAQRAFARAATAGTVSGDARPSSAVARKPAFSRKLCVRARDRVRRHSEIAGELAHRRQCVPRQQFSTLDDAPKLIDDLRERRSVEIGIDGDERRAHADRGRNERESTSA